MAFWGNSFIFNNVPCEDFGLMMYDVGSTAQSTGGFASSVSVVEEALNSRWKPYLYGVQYDRKLEFTIVFGVNLTRIDEGKYLDRYELEGIAVWLTGHNRYLWLEIEQKDLDYIRYRCMVSELKIVEYGNIPWALEAKIVCDSPYAYLHPQTFEYTVSGAKTIKFYNESGHNGFFMPKVQIATSGNSFSIKNKSDGDREFKFEGLPSAVLNIDVDNDLCIITNDEGFNLYPYFNYKFLRLVKGDNILSLTGNGTLKIICEFPVNVGG